MTRSQLDETSPEERQKEKSNRIESKIPKGYVSHFSLEDDGKIYLACYNPKEKDCTKAWVKVEA